MRKKGVALVLAAMMLWSLSAPAWAAENPFPDLRRDHWAFDSVVKLAAAGLIEGYPDGTFGGERTRSSCSRKARAWGDSTNAGICHELRRGGMSPVRW